MKEHKLHIQGGEERICRVGIMPSGGPVRETRPELLFFLPLPSPPPPPPPRVHSFSVAAERGGKGSFPFLGRRQRHLLVSFVVMGGEKGGGVFPPPLAS